MHHFIELNAFIFYCSIVIKERSEKSILKKMSAYSKPSEVRDEKKILKYPIVNKNEILFGGFFSGS